VGTRYQYPLYTEFTQKTPPVQEPADEGSMMRPVACRQYVTGAARRYHPDDRRPANGLPVRFFSVISPEERLGPVRGPSIRAATTEAMQGNPAEFVRNRMKRMGKRGAA
jgi:hypothetical protein